MVSKAFIIAAVIAYVEARFGQEQIPIPAISAVQGGAPGAASTIAGAAISDLLGGANSCAKLTRADQVFTELGGGADALAAAIGLVTAEKNTNPFANGNVQNVCGDASLPVTPELRGITPLIDPAVDVGGAAAALSGQTAGAPINADGLSVFDLMNQAGLGDLVVSQGGAGGGGGAAAAGTGAAAAQGGGQAANNANNQQQAGNQQDKVAGKDQAAAGQGQAAAGNNAAVDCNAGQDNAAGAQQNAAQNNNQQGTAAGNNNANNQQGAAAGNNNANDQQGAAAGNNNANDQQGAAAGNNNANDQQGAAGGQAAGAGAADFGKCTPTITFQGGEGNRPDTEFTFQIADPVARGGQGEALNPNIITNALCNQLTNVCDANAAAKAACEDAKAQVAAAGTRDKSTADLFNSALGFAGAVTNPAGGPANPPAAAGGAAKKTRSMRRGLRL